MRPSQGKESLSEAIVAAGLVRNASVINKIEKTDQNEENKKPKKTNIVSTGKPLFIEPQPKSKSQLKTHSIEDIIIDRQLNGPLPKLKNDNTYRVKTSNSAKMVKNISDEMILYQFK